MINGEPEIDQIGRLSSVDVSPIYAMETYGSESGEELAFFLETAESEEERRRIVEQARQNNEKLSGNLDEVLRTVEALIDKLSTVDNLHQLLNDYGQDTLGYDSYFTDFNNDKRQGHTRNNFGQDLRSLICFSEIRKIKRRHDRLFQLRMTKSRGLAWFDVMAKRRAGHRHEARCGTPVTADPTQKRNNFYLQQKNNSGLFPELTQYRLPLRLSNSSTVYNC